MNRLILIGNGFDLAHGLKTSYKDFMEFYLIKVFMMLVQNNYQYEDPLITIASKNNSRPIVAEYRKFESGIAYLNYLRKECSKLFDIKISLFLHSSHHNVLERNWVDIEMTYFHCLCTHIRDGKVDRDNVSILNRQLAYLKNELEAYLTAVETYQPIDQPDPDLLDIFLQPLFRKDFSAAEKTGDEIQFLNSFGLSQEQGTAGYNLIANFNYTQTLEPYLEAIQKNGLKNYRINYIHGKLKSRENPLIFGFGDEYNKVYSEFEEHNENSIFEHVKSFKYFQTNNNKNLLRFVSSDLFQVVILGHSCGLSDRTMLKAIFESENCRSIKIFHHKHSEDSNDYHEKTI
ncbi:AbiH family protein [Pedobacter helvus]|uniref:AbiH family protein n=1 Tax=Pedobacter helvus TaxID=2563444 RepID=A0ABW9JFB8_9SPHI|nr:AbiH family protein [Pedobacter ureilyticus]